MALLSYPSGYLLGRLYPPLALEDFWRRAAVRALLGLAIWPVVVALASLLGLRLTGTAVAIYVAVTAAATLVLALPSLVRSLTAPLPSPSSGDYVSKRGYAIAMPGTHSLALLVILLAALGLRWWARGRMAPVGDAVSHRRYRSPGAAAYHRLGALHPHQPDLRLPFRLPPGPLSCLAYRWSPGESCSGRTIPKRPHSLSLYLLASCSSAIGGWG